MSVMEPFFVVNPASGAGRTARLWRTLGRGLHFAFTRGPGHATELTADALARGEELIVAVGGDGTLNEALNGFYEDGRPRRAGSALSMLPCGTGGDLARTLGIAHVPAERILAGLEDGRLLQLDCGVARFAADGGTVERRFLNEASVGFSANIAARLNGSSKALGGRLVVSLGGRGKPRVAAQRKDDDRRGRREDVRGTRAARRRGQRPFLRRQHDDRPRRRARRRPLRRRGRGRDDEARSPASRGQALLGPPPLASLRSA